MTSKTIKRPKRGKSVLEMSAKEARAFFLKPGSYCNIEFPPYVRFNKLLTAVSKSIGDKKLSEMRNKQDPCDLDDVNYSLLTNKDGRHAWRPFQLIHPALYVSLVSSITQPDNWQFILERFAKYQALPNSQCISIPISASTVRKDGAEQVLQWWESIEQKSIELALDYNYVLHADLTDCYGAIYTHSIAWALHGKPASKKEKKNRSLLGNVIDEHIRQMRYGQTNGIPQGSTLMDFIAEMVLGYVDELLAEQVESIDNLGVYKILRYRDDYRIFVDSPLTGEIILKSLTEVLIPLGLRINTTKTTRSIPVISNSLKKDKLAWMQSRQTDPDLQKHLLLIHAHAVEYPNAGSLLRPLLQYYDLLSKNKSKISNPVSLVSIATDIAHGSPRTFPKCVAIISRILYKFNNDSDRIELVEKIHKKLSQLPNTGLLEIWLQRISYGYDDGIQFGERVCHLVAGDKKSLWNSSWIDSKPLLAALGVDIIDRRKLKSIKPVVAKSEIDLFYY